MILEEQIREWQQNVLNDYCRVCSDTCCNSQKHRISLDNNSILLFQEKGISLVNHRKLDTFSLIDWKKDKNTKLLLRDGSEVQKPSVVEVPQGMFGLGVYLYADICPFYNKEKGCEVHEDSRRSDVCKKYPIVFLGSNDSKGKMLDVKIIKSCEYFKREEVRSDLTEKFPVRIID